MPSENESRDVSASLGFAFFEVEDYLWLFLKQGKVH